MQLYFATQNPNKLKEIQKLLPSGIELFGLNDLGFTDEIPETSDTIEGNSLQKTKFIHDRFGVACFGDDTGLEVEALDGEPGVLSARYAGKEKDSEANMRLLLENLAKHPNRSARFKTVITFIDQQGSVEQFTGIVEGEITRTKSGTKGFGYDPIFKPKGYTMTFAEMDAAEKNAISHRGKAFQKLITFLKNEK